MKKNLKKLFAIIMTVAVVLSMALPTMAEEPTYTLTIQSSEKNAATTYNIYKVYSATVSNTNGKIGAVYTLEKAFEGLKTLCGEDASKIADGSASLQQVINAALPLREAASPVETDVTAKTFNVEPGYYLIVATGDATNGGTVTSPCLVAVPGEAIVSADGSSGGDPVPAVTVKPKTSETSLDKAITDSTGAGVHLGAEGNTSTAAVGDTIEYTIKSMIPAYGKDVKPGSITYTITDTAEDTLDYSRVVSVKVGETTVDADIYELNPKESGGHTFEIVFDYDKLTAMKEVTPGVTEVTIVAEFTLNNTAVIGVANNNTVDLEYTNNVYEETTSHLTDTVDTYTFGFGIQKVDSGKEKTLITGAEFEVRKGDTLVAKIVGAGDGNVTITVYDEAGTELSTTTGKDTGSYVFTGLDEGEYTVTETKAPDGYKKLDEDQTVTIVAEKSGDQYDGNYTVNGNSTENIDFMSLTAHGFQIENTQGTTLPGTGGIGTTIFTFGGLALIVLAGILLVVYTRKQKKA